MLHPRLTQTPQGHARSQGPNLVTLGTPIRSYRPFQVGGQIPHFHRVTKSQQDEFNDIPGGLYAYTHTYIHAWIHTFARMHARTWARTHPGMQVCLYVRTCTYQHFYGDTQRTKSVRRDPYNVWATMFGTDHWERPPTPYHIPYVAWGMGD